MINRRGVLGLVGSLPFMHLLNTHGKQHGLVSAITHNSKYYVVVQRLNREIKIPISFQPHGIFAINNSTLIVIGKRPSDLMAVVDLDKSAISKLIRLPYGRHFWGHGSYDIGTGSIYLTEYDFENEESIISQWKVSSMTQVDLFPSHGISGHDTLIDGQLLFCANGGFKTSPEFGRMILSQQISSSISVIDKTNHNLISTIQPIDKHMSFRHMCHTRDTVFIGLQNKSNSPQLKETTVAALDKKTFTLRPVLTEVSGKKGYITSIANFLDRYVVATSHLNNSIYIIDAQTKNLIKTKQAARPQGIQIIDDKAVITVETGLIEIDQNLTLKSTISQSNGIWQNHCLS